MEFRRGIGPAHQPICMSESRFNATLRDGLADGLPVDAFPSGWIHEVRKRGCAVSGDDSTTERVTDKLQIQLRKIKQTGL